jgi:hypothetical protein
MNTPGVIVNSPGLNLTVMFHNLCKNFLVLVEMFQMLKKTQWSKKIFLNFVLTKLNFCFNTQTPINWNVNWKGYKYRLLVSLTTKQTRKSIEQLPNSFILHNVPKNHFVKIFNYSLTSLFSNFTIYHLLVTVVTNVVKFWSLDQLVVTYNRFLWDVCIAEGGKTAWTAVHSTPR